MANHSERSDRYTAHLVLLSLIGFTVAAIASLALLEQMWPTVSAFLVNPQTLLKSSMSVDSPAISVTVALLSLLVTAVSIWSIGSLLVAEVAVRIARKREVPIEVTTKALKLVSPLARPLVRKRLASVALTTAILGAGAPAFAAPATEIPSDLGWHSTTTVVNVPQGAGDTQGQSNTNPNHPQANSQAQTEGPQPHSESSPTQTENSRSQGESPQDQAESSRTKSERSGPQNETSPTKGFSSSGEEGSQAKKSTSESTAGKGVISEDLTLKGSATEKSASPQTSAQSAVPQSQPTVQQNQSTAPQNVTQYVVKEGDSLWSIAARHLGVTDPAVISQGWHEIYELNKDSIGESPNLIHPGTVLNLPQD